MKNATSTPPVFNHSHLPRFRPKHVFMLVGGFLLLAWIAVLLVDGLEVLFAGRDVVMWQRLFGNGEPVEWMQWYTLGASILMTTYVAGVLIGIGNERSRGLAMFWLILGIGLALMLIEDAGNVRHEIRRIVERVSGSPRHTGRLDKVVEFTYFAALASVPVYALLRFGKHLRAYPTAMCYVLLGFGFYALAAICNATRNWGQWYAVAGSHLRVALNLPASERWDTPEEYGHMLIDSLLEESAELLGVMFLLAGIVAFWNAYRSQPGGRPSDR